MSKGFVYSTEFGTSADVFPKILRLYVKDGSVIADLTYGGGVFWKKVDMSKYHVRPSDPFSSSTIVPLMDARHTEYSDNELDVVVLDPPFGNWSTRPRRDGIKDRYNLDSLMTPKAVKQFYADAIDEAVRILTRRGILIVKCQDAVDGGKQHWMTELIYIYATRLGFRGEGKINMVPPGKPRIRHPDRPQQHERKNHSTFWIFRKMK